MKLPKNLRDKDPLLGDLPQMEPATEFSDHEWTAEELDDADRQVEQELWEEAFIEACFEEMLAEEEAQWQHYGYSQPGDSNSTDSYFSYYPLTHHQNTTDYQRQILVTCSKLDPEAPEFISKLNPEAPEFIPRGMV